MGNGRPVEQSEHMPRSLVTLAVCVGVVYGSAGHRDKQQEWKRLEFGRITRCDTETRREQMLLESSAESLAVWPQTFHL